MYVHAPYVINVATSNNRIRIPSRKLLLAHAEGAAAVGARGLIVHGGHIIKGDDWTSASTTGARPSRTPPTRAACRCPY